MLRYGGKAPQCDDWEDDVNRRVEHEGKDASKTNHKQHGPGETTLAYDGSQALPKTVHRTLQSVEPKVAEEKIWKEEGLLKHAYHDQASRAFAQ
jgi:hypothetical protein